MTHFSSAQLLRIDKMSHGIAGCGNGDFRLIHRDYIIGEVLQGEHQFTVFIARLDLFGLAVIGNNERDESPNALSPLLSFAIGKNLLDFLMDYSLPYRRVVS